MKCCKYFYEEPKPTHEIGMGRGFAITMIPGCRKVDAKKKSQFECNNCKLFEEIGNQEQDERKQETA
jgi:hypothetical protein